MRVLSYDLLWKKLIDEKMNKTELAEKTSIARSTMSKMSKNENVSLDVLVRICNYLDCGIDEIVSVLPMK